MESGLKYSFGVTICFLCLLIIYTDSGVASIPKQFKYSYYHAMGNAKSCDELV